MTGPSSEPVSRCVDVAGVRIHALDWGGAARPLVCLPSITANAASFHGLADDPAGERRVVALDPRGRGRSDVPADGYVEAYLRAKVRELADGVVRHRVAPWVREVENQSVVRTADVLSAVHAPTLILRSTLPMLRDGDAVLTRRDADRLAERIPDAHVVDVEETTHFSIMLGRHPATMAAIRTFLGIGVAA